MWYPDPIKPNFTPENLKIATTVASVSFAVLLIMFVMGGYLLHRYQRLMAFLSENEVQEFFEGRSESNAVTGGDYATEIENSQFNREFELSKSDVCIGKIRLNLYIIEWSS